MPSVLSPTQIDQFRREGFVIVRVLEGDELARCRAAADAMLNRPQFEKPVFHYISLVRESTSDPTLQAVLHHPRLLGAVEQLLGSDLVVDNCALLAAQPGVSYHQGWHRDVLQVPQEHITDDFFTPRWRHNNLQLNLALADGDRAFWAVPGSHARPDTPAERAAFGATRHASPPEAQMPGAVCVELRAGEAALYNNNLIHRGYSDFASPRRTLHFGYHSAKFPPTWHFYNFGPELLPTEYLARLSPPFRAMMEKRLSRLREFPDVKKSYVAGFDR